ncbi:MAG: OPT/YSL family transporter, partial [Vicinamibacteria bacterium]
YRLFDSRLFPATGIWPSGVATAECMIAGDRGGRRAALLAAGGLAGALGYPLGIPMDVFGVCWIGNIWALFMFGLGLLVRGYAQPVAGVDIEKSFLPHGFMIGAGLVALTQIVLALRRRSTTSESLGPERRLGASLVGGFGIYVVAALAMALAAGLLAEMSPAMLAGFAVYAAVSALASELLVGIAAMHSGWFPAFATAFVFLLVGMALGFPPVPLAFLVGFTASSSPAFADMGYDLKAGWILRGEGADPDLERVGRRAQLEAELLGIGVAALAVYFLHAGYFERNLFPPWDRVAAATISAGASPELAKALLLWAIPGALLQTIGGPARQLGVLFATGLLIHFPAAGWTAMASLAIRFFLTRRYGTSAEGPMYILAGGFIAGSALTSFGAATVKLWGREGPS